MTEKHTLIHPSAALGVKTETGPPPHGAYSMYALEYILALKDKYKIGPRTKPD